MWLFWKQNCQTVHSLSDWWLGGGGLSGIFKCLKFTSKYASEPPPPCSPGANSKIPEIPLEKNSGSAQDGCGEFTQVNHLPTISYMYIIKGGGAVGVMAETGGW